LIKIPRGKIYFSPYVLKRAFSVVCSGKIFNGESLSKFEAEFAKYIGTKHAIVTSSGTTALYLCLKALDIKKGDEIILPAYTVPEVVAMIILSGAKPVFVDIHPGTYNMAPNLVEERVSLKTKFLLLTHIYGQPCDIGPILKIAEKHNLKIVEDAAQACGAEYKGKKIGSFGALSCFSFGLMKNLNTLGGGAITTNNSDLANRIRKEISAFNYPNVTELMKRLFFTSVLSFLTHPLPFTLFVFPIIYVLDLLNENALYHLLRGKKKVNVNTTNFPEAYKVKFTNLQAAIGLKQLEELDKNNRMRMDNAEILSSLLSKSGFKIPYSLRHVKNVHLNYVIQVKDKKWLIRELLKRGIDVTEGYIKNCAGLETFREFRIYCPISEILSKNNLYLPVHPPLKKRHMFYIASSLRKLYPRVR